MDLPTGRKEWRRRVPAVRLRKHEQNRKFIVKVENKKSFFYGHRKVIRLPQPNS